MPNVVCNVAGSSILFGKRDTFPKALTKSTYQSLTASFRNQRCYTCCNQSLCNINYCSKVRPLPSTTSKPLVVRNTTSIALTTTSQAKTSVGINTAPSGTRLECYDCGDTELEDPSDCNITTMCDVGSLCWVGPTLSDKWTVKCRSKDVCNLLGSNVPFGKRSTWENNSTFRKIKTFEARIKRNGQQCYTCCHTNRCNIDYCSKKRPLPVSTSLVVVKSPPRHVTAVENTTETLVCQVFKN